ncbi:MAG: hypothetical protein WBN40_10815, partial [Pseudomonadales bacterium]
MLYAAAVLWAKHWERTLKQVQTLDACFIFSNVLIYTRTLSCMLERKAIPCFVIEHFFTGNDFYLEKRYSAIPNDSFLQSAAYREKYSYAANEISEVEKKLALAKNKNVTQPPAQEADFFANKNSVCLVLCQVANDAAIFSPNNQRRNTISFYCELVEGILATTD